MKYGNGQKAPSTKTIIAMNGINIPENTERNGNSIIGSPATTPGAMSIFDDDRLLVPYNVPSKNKKKWSVFAEKWFIPWYQIPWAIITASLIELLFHVFSDNSLRKILRFEPRKQRELWRFLTYMLVHDDWYHLMLNIFMQCLFASFLEKKQGRLAVVVTYLLGGVTGVLGASCVHPDIVIGASAGVYALLISNLAGILLEIETIHYKILRLICVGFIVLCDIIYNVVHYIAKEEPFISWGAHIMGGITGFLVGLIIFHRTDQVLSKRRNQILFWTGMILYGALLISLITLTLQIKKCTADKIVKKYVYFCKFF